MAQFRETPYGVFNYLVNLGDGSEGEIQGGFSEVSGLNAEVTVAEYRAGNAKVNYVQKVPAIHKAGDVTLKRGVVGADNRPIAVTMKRALYTLPSSISIRQKSPASS